MKYTHVLFLSALLFALLSCSGSEADTAAVTGAPVEEVVRRYQASIDNNRFAEARALSTRAEQNRLNDLERQLAGDLEETTILHTRFLKIDCRLKDKSTALCRCLMEDEYERYEAVYTLTLANGQWLVDAPQSDFEIDDDMINDILDEAFDRPTNRKEYPQ